uniref:TLC domain-containing protein n=1 Tax=Schistocephalus solidus TaxID=70667 RepID=A0A183SRH6_SCHSO
LWHLLIQSLYTTYILIFPLVSTGYFLHDISHSLRGPPRRHTVELLLHHILVPFILGYAIVSLLVEINSVFLHLRRLLLSLTVSRESVIFAVTSLLNFRAKGCQANVLNWCTQKLHVTIQDRHGTTDAN